MERRRPRRHDAKARDEHAPGLVELERWRGQRIAKVVGIESRGFCFAAPMAYALGAGLTIVRKPPAGASVTPGQVSIEASTGGWS